VYLETYYRHQPRNVIVDETPTNIKGHGLQIARWTLTKDQQLMKFNLGIDAKPDALLSPLLNPLEGSTMCSCGKLGLGRRSRLPAL
jgi:hypothetical protein